MRVSWILVVLWLAAVSRCDEPEPATTRAEPSPSPSPSPSPLPRAGDFVRLRGTLGEEVDCRTLHAENGEVYSLSVRLGRYPNGARVCIHGNVAEVSSCMTSPMLEVQALKPMSACP